MTSKSVPMRTCIGCRQVRKKKDLLRIVRTPEGSVTADFSGRMNGRGAYLCADPECLCRAAKRKAFARALSCEISGDDYSVLLRQLEEGASVRNPHDDTN